MMSRLAVQTFSQGLQAFMPLAVWYTWFRYLGRRDLLTATRWAAIIAIPGTFLAGYLFRATVHQSSWEAGLAVIATGAAFWFVLNAWRATPNRPTPFRRVTAARAVLAAAVILIIVRQTMEIAAVLQVAAIELRSLDATLAIGTGVALSAALACAWTALSGRVSAGALAAAVKVFAAVDLAQAALYAFHESAEARLLPWSEFLHEATEPYGPDGFYGPFISGLLIALPIAAALATVVGDRARRVATAEPAARLTPRRRAFLQAGALVMASMVFASGQAGDGSTAQQARSAARAAGAAAEVAALRSRPHLLFRHTGLDADYGMLAVASLDRPEQRAALALDCERVSFAAGQGICLQARRGAFTRYSAALLDGSLATRSSIKLDGAPTRTRVSADGRVGAMTVFVSGHSYNGSFSTQTTLIDMAGGEQLGELEQFATWRDGARFQRADFNFWGVTFARDSNIFYASLRTQGMTYLVRGDLGLRKMTVLRQNVECPALSPNNRLIAFKSSLGPNVGGWRFRVLDLATMAERDIAAETRSIDDQVEWLDDTHVLYGVRRPSSAIADVWVAPIEGTEPARVFLPQAESPIVVR
jgi:hypothetical protein